MSLRKLLTILLIVTTASAQMQSGGNGGSGGNVSSRANSTVPSWQQVLPPIMPTGAATNSLGLLNDNATMAATGHTGTAPTAVNHVYTSPMTLMGQPTTWTEACSGGLISGTTTVAAATSMFFAADGTTLMAEAANGTALTMWYCVAGGSWTQAAAATSPQGTLFFSVDANNCWFLPGDYHLWKSSDSHCTSFSDLAGVSIPTGSNQGIFGATGTGAGGAPNTGNHYQIVAKDWGDGNGNTLSVCGEGGLTQIVPTFVTGTATFTNGSTSVTLSAGNAGLVVGNLFSSNASTKGGTVITTYPGSGTALSIFPAAIASGSANYYSFKLVQAWLGEMTATATNGSTTFTLAAYYPWLDGLSGVPIANGSTGVGIPGGTTGSISGTTVTLSTPATGSPMANTTYVVGTPGAVASWGGYHSNCTGIAVGSTAVLAWRGNNASTTHINSIPTTGTRTVTSVASPLVSPNTNIIVTLRHMHDQTFYYNDNNGGSLAGRFYTTNNGATWTDPSTFTGMDASCMASNKFNGNGLNSNNHFIMSRCLSPEWWIYGPI